MSAEVVAMEERLAKLAEEIRTYPGPIAGCDVQLTALLEERALLQAALKDLGEAKP
jgi:hypothetical protein